MLVLALASWISPPAGGSSPVSLTAVVIGAVLSGFAGGPTVVFIAVARPLYRCAFVSVAVSSNNNIAAKPEIVKKLLIFMILSPYIET